MRNLLAHVSAAHKEMVAATVRRIFAETTPPTARARLHEVVGMLEQRFLKVAELLVEAEVDVSPAPRSLVRIRRRSPRPTRSKGFMSRSSGAPMWWASSPMTPRSSGSSGP
jgi:hypothetical protein